MPRLVAPVVLLLTLAAPAQADPLTFSDGFESPTLDPFWSTFVQSGAFSFTSSPVHGGTQAVQYDSFATGQQKNVLLLHQFPAPLFGQTSVWVFDTGANVASSNYLELRVDNLQTGQLAHVIGYDFDLGPANGGNYNVGAGAAATFADVNSGVDRTRAWHQFLIDSRPSGLSIAIDGQTVFTGGPMALDRISVNMFGPGFRPAWTGYFDDFSFREFAAETSAVPEPASLVVFAGLLGVGLSIARRRRVAV